jgi:hypothetical protein
MSKNIIVINCANLKVAQRRLQMVTGGMGYLPYGTDFYLGLLPVLETFEVDGQIKWSRLAKYLNERGFVTSAGKRWGPVTINRLIGVLADVIRVSAWVKTP